MELIKYIGKLKLKTGYLISYGEFLCSFCNKKVEKTLSNGSQAKSCGCQRYNLSSKTQKGKNKSEEHKKKISESKKGKKLTEEHKQKLRGKKGYWTGLKLSEETKQKMRDNHVNFSGKKHPMYGKHLSNETKQKIKDGNTGKIISEKTKNKYSEVKRGHNNPNWQGGKSFEPYSPEFNKKFKQQILERDNHVCQCQNCEHRSIKLDIHHIDYDKKNNSDKNLITLCDSCHTKTNGKNERQYYTEYYQNIMKARII